MTREEIIEELENTVGLIRQDGKDWLDERDIPFLESVIVALKAESKTGHWEWDSDFWCHRCSECHLSKDSKYFNYCSNCGAKMEVKDDYEK